MFSDTMMLGGSGRKAAFPVENSLLFRGAQYLSRTPAVLGERKKWTWSGWVRRASLDSMAIFTARISTIAGEDDGIVFTTAGNIEVWFRGQLDGRIITTKTFNDLGAWYHIVLAYDADQVTGSNRVKLYVNGIQETSFSIANYPAQYLDSAINNTVEHRLGRRCEISYNNLYFGGYMADVHFVGGQTLTPAQFGEVNPVTSSWRPKIVSGLTYGTNGFRLGNPWAGGSLGTDSSGLGNNWTPFGFSPTDVVADTPNP